MKQVNKNWLAFLRIGVPMIILISFLSIQNDFDSFYGVDGFVKPEILDATHDELSPTIFKIHQYINETLNISMKYESLLLFIRISYPIALLFLALGFLTKPMAILSLLLQLVLIKSIHYYQYGFDFFSTILLFYCIIFPVGKVFSLDNVVFKRKYLEIKNQVVHLRLLRIHICIVYFFGGFGKILGITWWNGEAMWKASTAYNDLNLINLDYIQQPWVFMVLGWSIVILEILYPVFINIKKTRNIWLLSIILMHLTIASIMGLFFFSAILIVFNICAYYIPYLPNTVEMSNPLRSKQSLPVNS